MVPMPMNPGVCCPPPVISASRADDTGRDRRQHVGLHRIEDRLDRPAEDRHLLLHLGDLYGPPVPEDHRGMARAQSGDHDRDGTRLFGSDLGGARPARRTLSETMKLLITGVSHKTAPVEIRERL